MNQNESEKEELEKAFLSINFDAIEKKITPNKKLENYELDIKEIMEAGFNRQMAEYALIKMDIESKLKNENKIYTEAKEKFIDKIKETIQIKTLLEKAKNDSNIDFKNLYEEIPFEEIIEQIINIFMEELDEVITFYKFKSYLIKTIKENKEIKNDLDDFIKVKENYIKKRVPFIQAAHRLIKKISNDKNEYQEFYDFYNNKNDN